MSLQSEAWEMREMFFHSAQELLQALNDQGLALETNPADAAAVREIRRAVHTLKGDSAACGFRELSKLAHELEDVLAPEIAAANGVALAEVVLSAADMFDAMCTAYRGSLDPPNGDPLRAMIWKLAPQAQTAVAGELTPGFSWSEYDQVAMAEAVARGLRVFEIAIRVAPQSPMRAASLQLLRKVLPECGTILASAPEEHAWAETQHLEFAVATERDEAWLAAKCAVPGVVDQIRVKQFEPAPEPAAVSSPAASAEGAAKVPGNGSGRKQPPGAAARRVPDNSLHVDAERIDTLLNLVGELVIGKSMLHQTLNDFAQRFPKDPARTRFADAMAFQSQVLNALQRAVMKIRMVPVEQLFRRFPRQVRDVAKACGKNVNLAMSGQETELDKGLLDAVAEPLAHLVRNAIDHGIETPQERRAAGKPERACLRLHARHEGNQVVIEVSDDGRGIDHAAVVAKAVASGLITLEQASRMPDADVIDLIFEPGFSTAGQVTEISGRGVGLDVVKDAVQKLKGSVSVETEPGRGTTVRLRLPLTLAIIRAMLFHVAERLYAIPLECVREIARAGAADVHQVDGHEVWQLRDEVLTLVRLNRLVSGAAQTGGERLFVVVVGNGERKFGLVVDQLVGEEELVIKPLDENVVASELVSGASILGDGTVVLILNVGELVTKFARCRAATAAVPPHDATPSMEARA